MNDEFLRLRQLHSENFVRGMNIAKSKSGYKEAAYDQKLIRISNEVCDLVRQQTGTYGSTIEIRERLDAYVKQLAINFGV